MQFDTKPEKYYQHQYGLGAIVWRNFNFAFRENKTGEYRDVGNFIIIEDENEKYGVEVALWASTMIKEMYDLDHTLETTSLNDIYPWLNNPMCYKLQDSIIASVLLFRNGVRPNSSNTKGRVLKTYLKGILLYSELLHVSLDEIFEIIQAYENREYGANDVLPEMIYYLYWKTE